MISGAAFSASLVACVRIRHVIVLAILLVPAGMAWLWVLMSATGALQVFLPGWVRARGLSTFNIVFADGQAIGAFFRGLLAQWVGFVPAFIAAAAVMALSTVTVAVWPFHDVSGLQPRPRCSTASRIGARTGARGGESLGDPDVHR
jgi:Transmembrane secretion effector